MQRFTFDVYADNGRITREHLAQVLHSILKENQITITNVDELVNHVVDELDKSKTDAIEFDEFKAFMKQHPETVKRLTVSKLENILYDLDEEDDQKKGPFKYLKWEDRLDDFIETEKTGWWTWIVLHMTFNGMYN